MISKLSLSYIHHKQSYEHHRLKDLKALNRSPDFLSNVKIHYVMVNLGFYLNIFCFTIYGHGGHFGQVT